MHKKNWSYWEEKEVKKDIDLIIVGAGFTGLSAAIRAKELHPKWKVVILERDQMGEGASTKNAGFACYGTLGEFLADQAEMGRDQALELILKRREGLKFLLNTVDTTKIDWQQLGGVELFLDDELGHWEACQAEISALNQDLGFTLYQESKEHQKFNKSIGSIYTLDEAQLNPVKLWRALYQKAILLDIIIQHGVKVDTVQSGMSVKLGTSLGDFHCKQVLYCTNAFGTQGYDLDLIPSRNQVYVVENSSFKLDAKSYHQNCGYLYFRGLGNQILIGGARHISYREEISVEMAGNEKIEQYLKDYLKKHFSNKGEWRIHNHWSGIIATGNSKKPIVKKLDENIYCCLRFGGMGVALSSLSGSQAIDRFFS